MGTLNKCSLGEHKRLLSKTKEIIILKF